MLCMIFALAIIALATLAATAFAMSLMGWMLGFGLILGPMHLGHMHMPADASFDDEAEAQASGATS